MGGDPARLRLAMALQLTLPGAPSIYYGDEVAMAGAADPDCRRAYPPIGAELDAGRARDASIRPRPAPRARGTRVAAGRGGAGRGRGRAVDRACAAGRRSEGDRRGQRRGGHRRARSQLKRRRGGAPLAGVGWDGSQTHGWRRGDCSAGVGFGGARRADRVVYDSAETVAGWVAASSDASSPTGRYIRSTYSWSIRVVENRQSVEPIERRIRSTQVSGRPSAPRS